MLEEFPRTHRQAAAYLGVQRQRIYDLVEADRLQPISPGLYVFTQAALDTYNRERAQRPKGGRPPKRKAHELAPAD